jgi:predicted RNase H-like HicB family nuclease
MAERTFTAIYVHDDPWWIGFVEEAPGAMSQGATRAECQANLREALALMLEVQREDLAKELAGHAICREPLVVA